MNALAKFVAALGLVPIAVFRSCDHNLIDAEEYTAVAGEISRTSIGPISVTSASYLAVCARTNPKAPRKEPYFRVRKATFVTYIEKNGQAGYQSGDGGDVFVDSKGSDNDRPQAKVRIASLSSHNDKGVNGDHWQLEVVTDTDSNKDGRDDRLVTHGSF